MLKKQFLLVSILLLGLILSGCDTLLAANMINSKKSDTDLASIFKSFASQSGQRQSRDWPINVTETVYPNQIDVYSHYFNGDVLADVLVVSVDDEDIDLVIRDVYGNSIDEDNDSSGFGHCTWVPAWTDAFTIEVINMTDTYVTYTMFSN
jgi:hypothetical protein